MSGDPEIQERTCRSCDEKYPYPVLRGSATRFYCAHCADLPAEIRGVFEKYNKRVREMKRIIEKLEREIHDRRSQPSSDK